MLKMWYLRERFPWILQGSSTPCQKSRTLNLQCHVSNLCLKKNQHSCLMVHKTCLAQFIMIITGKIKHFSNMNLINLSKIQLQCTMLKTVSSMDHLAIFSCHRGPVIHGSLYSAWKEENSTMDTEYDSICERITCKGNQHTTIIEVLFKIVFPTNTMHFTET